jgi:hypothetical protein
MNYGGSIHNNSFGEQHVESSRPLITVRSGSKSIQTTITRRKGRLSTKTAKCRVIGSKGSTTGSATALDTLPRSARHLTRSSSPQSSLDNFPSDTWANSEFSSDFDVGTKRSTDATLFGEGVSSNVAAKRTRVSGIHFYIFSVSYSSKGFSVLTMVATSGIVP